MPALVLRVLVVCLIGASIYIAIAAPLGIAVRNSRDIAGRQEMARYFAEMKAESAARPKPPVARTIILGEPVKPQRIAPL